MPLLTITVDDPCPLLAYSPTGWTQGTSQSDNKASSYYLTTFHPTNRDQSSVSFTFNGTGVQIFGARRGNHGNFQITIDNNAFPSISGASAQDKFQDSLFSTTALTQGLHTLTLTNQPTDGNHNFVDIDFITWQSNIGKDDDQLVVRTVQDMDPAFVYQPANAWTSAPDHIGLFSGGTGHSIGNGTSGDGIQLYGPIGPNGSPYSISIDGGPSRQFSASNTAYTPQMMLFHADNLGDGKHVLKLEHQPAAPNQQFAIDYANVLSSSSMSSAQNTAPQNGNSSSGNSSSGLSGGLIAGIVLPILVIIGCVVVVGIILVRRRRARQEPNKSVESSSWLQGYGPSPPVEEYQPPPSFGSRSNYTSYRGPPRSLQATSPSDITFTSVMQSQSSVSLDRRSTYGRSYYTSPSERAGTTPYGEPEVSISQAYPASSQDEHPSQSNNTTNNNFTNSTNPRPSKGEVVLASNNGVSRSLSPINEGASGERDGGSITGSPLDRPPPNYSQATEPYVSRRPEGEP
ncbi:hypothetical protein ONZ45_g12880 [Pleurotus djamor]|nr:hypothetical protein ONZ45_g12880 [Pleurotus djamor]